MMAFLCTNASDHGWTVGLLLLLLQYSMLQLAVQPALMVSAFSLGPTSSGLLQEKTNSGRRLRRKTPIVFLIDEEPTQSAIDEREFFRMYPRPRSIALIPIDENESEVFDVDTQNHQRQQTKGQFEFEANNEMADQATPITRAEDPVEVAETKVENALMLDNISVAGKGPESNVAYADKMVKKPVDKNISLDDTDNSERTLIATTQDPWNATEIVSVSAESVRVLEGEYSFFAENDLKPRKLDETELESILDNFSVKKDEVLVLENAEGINIDVKDVEESLLPPGPPETTPSMSLLSEIELDADVVCSQAFASVKQHPILLFDGACNLCNGWVNFCLDHDAKATFRYASLQSKVGQSILIRDGRPPDDRSDIILATPRDTYAKSDAVLRVISQLDGLPILLRLAANFARLVLPSWFRNAVYKFVAVNRHILGDADGPVCRLDLDGEYIGRFIEDPELDEYDENLASESEEEVYVVRR